MNKIQIYEICKSLHCFCAHFEERANSFGIGVGLLSIWRIFLLAKLDSEQWRSAVEQWVQKYGASHRSLDERRKIKRELISIKEFLGRINTRLLMQSCLRLWVFAWFYRVIKNWKCEVWNGREPVKLSVRDKNGTTSNSQQQLSHAAVKLQRLSGISKSHSKRSFSQPSCNSEGKDVQPAE